MESLNRTNQAPKGRKTVVVNIESITVALRAVPVIKALQARDDYQVKVVSTLQSTGPHPDHKRAFLQLLRQEDIKLSFGMLGPEVQARLDSLHQAYERQFTRAYDQLMKTHSLSYRGVSLARNLGGFILEQNQNKLGWQCLAQELVKYYQADLFVSGYDFGGVKRQFAVGAKTMGVPTLGLQYGGWSQLRSQRVCDYFTLWGQQFHDLHTDGGYPPERLFITGSPHLDPILTRPEYQPAPVLQGIGLDPALKTIFFGLASQDMTTEVADLVGRLGPASGVQVIFKMHPELDPEDRERYLAILKNCRAPHVVLQLESTPPAALLQASDVVVTCVSNIVWEALAFKKDIVLYWHPESLWINAQGKGVNDPFMNNGDRYTLLAKTPAELSQLTMQALENPGLCAASEESAYWRERIWYKLDGQASGRTVAVFDQVLANPRIYDPPRAPA